MKVGDIMWSNGDILGMCWRVYWDETGKCWGQNGGLTGIGLEYTGMRLEEQ